MLMTPVLATAHANPARTVSEFKLANGLVVVVVPDNRAPVVTHGLLPGRLGR
jgi:zinc protease